ncbi:adenylate/guanylate cyclase domain-containing protein [Alsobacter sp. R-9]
MPHQPSPPTRRLAAIMAADVVGSSRMMGQDEAGTLAAIRALLEEVIGPAAARRNGRVVKTLGDGALIEFASPVEAVLCAVETQAALGERMADAAAGGAGPGGTALRLRIGVNCGDTVISPEGDVHGDSVNVAVRLEGLADPGGLCISGKVYDELEGRLVLPFEDRGEQALKNIARPVRVYALRAGHVSAREPAAARPAPERGDRPSIAVLPFTNLSGDPGQEYLADGIADDILTALAKARWLFVMARSSSFAFKGRAIETDQIARRLGVRYVLSGSLRRSAARIRVSVQLVDAETGVSLWAERYDRPLDDVLDLQDEVAEAVAGAIEPELLRTEGRRGAERSQSLSAWELVRRGMWEFHKIRPDGHRAARELFRQAIAAEPNGADGHVWLARAEAGLAAYGWTDDIAATLDSGLEAGRRAVALDERNPYAHYAVAVTHMVAGLPDPAIAAARRALALSPSFALGHLVLGGSFAYGGRAAEAIAPLEHGLRLSPYDPQNFTWFLLLALSHGFSGDPAKGLQEARHALALRPHWPPANLAVALCALALGDKPQARAALADAGTPDPAAGDPLGLIARYNPAWAERIGDVVARLREPDAGMA